MKNLFGFLALWLLSATAAFGANYGDKQYSLTVNDERGFNISSDAGQVSDSVMAFVYTAGTKTLATVYADRKRTARTNPISRAQFATDGRILFYGPSSSYDIFIAHTDGSSAVLAGATPLTHRISLNRNSVERHLILPWTQPAAVETSTGVALPYDCYVHDVAVEVVTAESGKTLSVGTLASESGGSGTGFVNAVSTTTAGYPSLVTITTGSNETFFASTLLGAFLQKSDAGADTALHYGSFFRSNKVISGTTAHTITYTGSSGGSTGTGFIHLFFRLLR